MWLRKGGRTCIVIHSDSQFAVKHLLEDTQVPDANFNLILQCRELVTRITNIQIQFSPRRTNVATDILAKTCRVEDSYYNNFCRNPVVLFGNPCDFLVTVIQEDTSLIDMVVLW